VVSVEVSSALNCVNVSCGECVCVDDMVLGVIMQTLCGVAWNSVFSSLLSGSEKSSGFRGGNGKVG